MASTVHIDISMKDRMSKVAKKASRSLLGVKKSVKKTDDAMKKLNTTQGKTVKGMKAMGKMKGLLGVAAVAAGTKKAFGAAATAETAALKILSNVTDRAKKNELRPIIKAALEDAQKMGIPIEEAGNALFTMTSQMGTSSEVFENFRGAMKLSVGGFADFQSSVSVTNKLIAQFSDLGGDAEKTARMIFAAQVLGDTDVNQLANALPSAAGAAAVAGLESSEFLSIIAAQSKKTKNTVASAEGLKGFLTSFSTVTKGSAREKAFAKLKIAPGTENLGKQGVINVMKQIVKMRGQEGGQKLIDEAFTDVGAKTFINNMDDAMLAAIVSGADEIASSEALDMSFEDVNASMAASANKLAEATDRGFAIIGNQLAPAISSLSDAMVLAEQEAEAGNSFIVAAFGNSIATLASSLTGNLDNIEKYRAERRQELGVGITVDNKTDNPVGVTTQGSPGLDTGVQQRGS